MAEIASRVNVRAGDLFRKRTVTVELGAVPAACWRARLGWALVRLACRVGGFRRAKLVRRA